MAWRYYPVSFKKQNQVQSLHAKLRLQIGLFDWRCSFAVNSSQMVKMVKEVTLRIYLSIDSNHLSQQHGGHFTRHTSASSMSGWPSVLISRGNPKDYISHSVLVLIHKYIWTPPSLPSSLTHRRHKTDCLPLMVLTHWQIILWQRGVVFVSVWVGDISGGTVLQSQLQVNW